MSGPVAGPGGQAAQLRVGTFGAAAESAPDEALLDDPGPVDTGCAPDEPVVVVVAEPLPDDVHPATPTISAQPTAMKRLKR